MTDDTENVNIEIDPDHPWVEASQIMTPKPTTCFLQCEPYQVEFANGKVVDVAHVQAITSVGVFDLFLTPPTLLQFLEQAGNTIQVLAEAAKKQGGLQVAGPQDVKTVVDADRRLRGV